MNPTPRELREAQDALARVGMSVEVKDKFLISIRNLDQKPMLVTREQARVLAQALPVIDGAGV